MITLRPQNKYDTELRCILMTEKQYSSLPDGVKSIIYDLVHEVQKAVNFNWEDADLVSLTSKVSKAYLKSPNILQIQVIANCINACFPDLIAKVDSTNDKRELIVAQRKAK